MKHTKCIKTLSQKVFRRGINYDLSHIKTCLQQLGNPQNQLPKTIHIAGTNGKGSTLTFLAAGLQAAGFTVGTFTSPHIKNYTERIQLNAKTISKDKFTSIFSEIQSKLTPNFDTLTEFEVLTLMAIIHFASKKPDFCIFETGLGGRLDATNTIQPHLTLLTPISLDHQAILGETITKIAAEKAGIIKPNIPILCAKQFLEAQKVITATAIQNNAPLTIIKPRKLIAEGFKLNANYQTQNLALAEAAIDHLIGPGTSKTPKILAGLKNAIIFGRFQRIETDRQTIILDAAHNQAGIMALKEALTQQFPNRKPAIVVGLQKNRSADLLTEFLTIGPNLRYCEFCPENALPIKKAKDSLPNLPTWKLNSFEELSNEHLIVFSGSIYFLSALSISQQRLVMA